jgi:uncharacterized phiE125 gp8 family phage protein
MLDWLARPVHIGLTRTTPPTGEPVSLAEAKEWLHVTDTYEDGTIYALVQAAYQKVEDDTGLALMTQTWTYSVDKRPADNVFVLPVGPVASVTSVTSYSEQDAPTVISAAVYRTDTRSLPARIVLNENQSWPTNVRRHNAYQIVFVAGYGGAESVPQPLLLAIRMLLHHWHANRQAVNVVAGLNVGEVPLAYDALISPYKLRVSW